MNKEQWQKYKLNKFLDELEDKREAQQNTSCNINDLDKYSRTQQLIDNGIPREEAKRIADIYEEG